MPSRFWKASGNALLPGCNTFAIAPTGFTWDNTSGGGNITFTNGNLTATESGGGAGVGKGTVAGSGFFIVNVDNVGANMRIGLANASASPTSGLGSDGNSIGYDAGGSIDFGASFSGTPATYTTGDVIKVAWDGTTVSFYKNGALQGTHGSSGLTGVKPAFSAAASNGALTLTDYTNWS